MRRRTLFTFINTILWKRGAAASGTRAPPVSDDRVLPVESQKL
jgi:hypothetical protein